MHRVLVTPEILRTISYYLDPQSNVSNAVVCKIWSDVALDELWRDVDNLPRLFNLLVPLDKSRTRFSRQPTATDWASFQHYTKRVRSLTYLEDKHKLSQKLHDDISQTRISLAIFPRLETLHWRANLGLMVLFMTPTVKCFDLYIPVDTAAGTLCNLADDVAGRMTNLVSLDLHIISKNQMHLVAPPDIMKGMLELLIPLCRLQKLVIPRFFFTTRLAELLSNFPRLTHIDFDYLYGEVVGDPEDIKIFAPNILSGAYSSLVDLNFCSTYEDSARFIGSLPSPSILTHLFIESPLHETRFTVHHILDTLSKKCHRLEELVLNPPRWKVDTIDDGERIDLTILKPVFACKNLQLLAIYHHYPLDLTLQDLEKLARGLSSLTSLFLNEEPGYFESTDLTLEALFPFARNCPSLRHLGLFVNASSDAVPDFCPTSPPPIFSKLTTLGVGLSKITNPIPVAVYLSHMLPKSCHIEHGLNYWMLFDLDAKCKELLEIRQGLWNEVNTSLSLFINIREEEREKTKATMQIIGREGNRAMWQVKQEFRDGRSVKTKQEEE